MLTARPSSVAAGLGLGYGWRADRKPVRQRAFDFGTLPVLTALRRYFQAANTTGTANVNDLDVAAAQLLGMIATVVFWPRLVHGNWSLTSEETLHTINEAARTIAARYATPGGARQADNCEMHGRAST
jgi:hypothetical protein